MPEHFFKQVDRLEKKYDRFGMLFFAIIVWAYAIYLTMNLETNRDNTFHGLHMVGLCILYFLACGYTGIFICWKWFNKSQICNKQ